MSMSLYYKLVHHAALPPLRSIESSAGFDLFTPEALVMQRGELRVVDTGVAVIIPAGHVGLVLPRSSMSAHGLAISTGVIDADYRGTVRVVLRASHDQAFACAIRSRIAQLVIVPIPQLELVNDWPDELSNTARGDAGFGSTGV